MALRPRRPQRVIQIGRDLRPHAHRRCSSCCESRLRGSGCVTRYGLAFGTESLVLHAVRRQGILGHADPLLKSFKRSAYCSTLTSPRRFRAPSSSCRANGNIAVLIDAVLVGLYGAGSAPAVRSDDAFVLEGLGRNQAGLAHRAMIHADGRPTRSACRFRSSRLAKTRPGRKFVSTVQKLRSSPAFRLECFSLVAEEFEAVLPGESRHFRHDHRSLPGAAQPRQIGVVDDALPGGVAPERQRLVEETLHPESD